MPCDDAQQLAALRQKIYDLPSFGYRRACGLVNRQRDAKGSASLNAKRVYRVMAQAKFAAAQGTAPALVIPQA